MELIARDFKLPVPPHAMDDLMGHPPEGVRRRGRINTLLMGQLTCMGVSLLTASDNYLTKDLHNGHLLALTGNGKDWLTPKTRYGQHMAHGSDLASVMSLCGPRLNL